MFKRLTILFGLALLLNACYEYNAPKKPENLISKGKMANILIDLRLMSSAKGINKKVLDSNNVKPAQYIFKKYNIDSLQFALSNDYYAFYVADYEEIYIKVHDSLEALKVKYKSLIDEEAKAKKIADSLERVENLKKIKDTLINDLEIDDIEFEDLEIEEIEDVDLITPVSSGN